MGKTELIRQIYRDFMTGNVGAILATFDADIEFRLAESHPYRGEDPPWRGKDAIVEKFFKVAAPEWDGWSIAVDATVEAEDAVIVEGRYHGIYKPTKRRMDVQVCHVWRFRGPAVTSFHQYVDTARLADVMRPGAR
jgi:ketosteroid isomerase-like protein